MENTEDFKELVKDLYKTNTCASVDGGIIQFSPEGMKEVVGAEKLTYDEYLEIQFNSLHKQRSSFEQCYFETPVEFKGQIEKITQKHICFKRIYVCGMRSDGICFDGKEDHVWMDVKGFEALKVGDCVEFFADVYRYLKTGNGKMIDYGLRNPERIKKIADYALPTDEELKLQALQEIVCETCIFADHCNRIFCLLGK